MARGGSLCPLVSLAVTVAGRRGIPEPNAGPPPSRRDDIFMSAWEARSTARRQIYQEPLSYHTSSFSLFEAAARSFLACGLAPHSISATGLTSTGIVRRNSSSNRAYATNLHRAPLFISPPTTR